MIFAVTRHERCLLALGALTLLLVTGWLWHERARTPDATRDRGVHEANPN